MKIVCLPVPGSYNPYQHLMIGGLNKTDGFQAFAGLGGRNFALYRSIRKYQPDFLHLDWIHSYYMHKNSILQYVAIVRFLLELQLIKTTKTKVVWTIHNLYPHRSGKNRWQRLLRTHFAGQCAWVRVFDEETAELVEKEFGLENEKIRILPEGSYVDFYPDTVSPVSARKSFEFTANEKVLLYLGTIEPYKGIFDLINAFGQLTPAVSTNCRLLIAGTTKTPHYLESIRLLAQKNPRITFVEGYVPDEDLQNYFAAASVVCLPFQKIANSGSTIMAMGFGKPVIAPRRGAVAYRLQQQDQLLYDDVTELTTILHYALSLSSLQLSEIGEKNRRALKKYQWSDFGTLFSGEENVLANS